MSQEKMPNFEGTQAGREGFTVGAELATKLSLYEMYRPQTFEQMVGQDAAVRKIRFLLRQRWGGRAWWISGSSGTGKTTLARLIGRYRRGMCDPEHMLPNDYRICEVDAAYFSTAKARQVFREAMQHPNAYWIINDAHKLPDKVVLELSTFLEREETRFLHDGNLFEDTFSVLGSVAFTALRDVVDELKDKNPDMEPLLSRFNRITLSKRVQPLFIQHVKRIIEGTEYNTGCRSETAWEKMAKECHGNLRAMWNKVEEGWAAGLDDAIDGSDAE